MNAWKLLPKFKNGITTWTLSDHQEEVNIFASGDIVIDEAKQNFTKSAYFTSKLLSHQWDTNTELGPKAPTETESPTTLSF